MYSALEAFAISCYKIWRLTLRYVKCFVLMLTNRNDAYVFGFFSRSWDFLTTTSNVSKAEINFPLWMFRATTCTTSLPFVVNKADQFSHSMLSFCDTSHFVYNNRKLRSTDLSSDANDLVVWKQKRRGARPPTASRYFGHLCDNVTSSITWHWRQTSPIIAPTRRIIAITLDRWDRRVAGDDTRDAMTEPPW